jgi:hypothetical protein
MGYYIYIHNICFQTYLILRVKIIHDFDIWKESIYTVREGLEIGIIQSVNRITTFWWRNNQIVSTVTHFSSTEIKLHCIIHQYACFESCEFRSCSVFFVRVEYRTPAFTQPFSWHFHITITYNLPHLPLKRHISIGVFVVCIDIGSPVPNIPSKSRGMPYENKKLLTEWKWFETKDFNAQTITSWKLNLFSFFIYCCDCTYMNLERKTIRLDIFLLSDRQWGIECQYLLMFLIKNKKNSVVYGYSSVLYLEFKQIFKKKTCK